MDVIEAMNQETFDSCCDAGAELLEALRGILQRRGLSDEDATAVISVAAAGVLTATTVDAATFAAGTEMTQAMWKCEPGQVGLNALAFDPPHRRPGVETGFKPGEN